MVTFSVIIPTHNRLEGLRRALNSLLAQTQAPQEVIVIDDGSSVPVPGSVLNELARHVNCTLLRNNTPCGGNRARNIGLEASSSDYVCFLDDDDEFLPEKVEVIAEAVTQSRADVYYHPALMNYDQERIQYRSTPNPKVSVRDLLVTNGVGGTSMVCVDRSKFLSIGGFDENLPALQDYEAWLRCAKEGLRFNFVPKALTAYHHVTGQGSVSKSIENLNNALSIISSKYAEDLEGLTRREKRKRDEINVVRLMHRQLMRGENIRAAASGAGSGLRQLNIRLILMGLIAAFGLKASLFVKTKMGS